MPCVAHKRRSGVAFFIGGDKLRLQPITRKERFLYEIVGWGETAPEKPTTPEEFFFAAILGEAVQVPEPLTRYQMYLAKIAGRNISVPKPLTRLELFLAKACGMDIETPTPITREEIFWANYKGIEQIIEGIPPLTFNAIAGTLKNYKIYGNTVNGESVGDLVTDSQSEHYGNYAIPITNNSETANIYLDEPLRKVGDEADYVDYATQKQHRVRNNIFSGFIRGIRLNTVTSIEESNNNSYTTDYLPVEANMLYTYSGGSDRISVTLFAYDSLKKYIGRTTNVVRTTDIFWMSTNTSGLYTTFRSNLTGNNNPIKYIRVTYADAGDSLVNAENIMLNSGSTALPYEPYIENTELDVTIPALPTLSGTNMLSVGTEVQPSNVYIKYEEER